MALSTITTGVTKRYSDLVLGNVLSTDIGYCVEEVQLTKTATLDLGSVLTDANVEAAAAADADRVFIWLDSGVLNLEDLEDGETFTGVVARRGVTLNQFLVKYSDGSMIDDAGVEALATKGLKVTDKVVNGASGV